MSNPFGTKHKHTRYRSGEPTTIGWYATRQKKQFGPLSSAVHKRLVRRFWDGSGTWSVPLRVDVATENEIQMFAYMKDHLFGSTSQILFSGLRHAS